VFSPEELERMEREELGADTWGVVEEGEGNWEGDERSEQEVARLATAISAEMRRADPPTYPRIRPG
jgi:hypothetical protein